MQLACDIDAQKKAKNMANVVFESPDSLNPAHLYSLHGFYRVTGLNSHHIRAAKKLGLALPAKKIGKRKFIEGHAGADFLIEFADRLAAERDRDAAAVSAQNRRRSP